MARGGARDAARQMLSQLQEMLENLRAQPYAQQNDPAAQQGQQLMRDLNNLAQQQQNLLDQTYREFAAAGARPAIAQCRPLRPGSGRAAPEARPARQAVRRPDGPDAAAAGPGRPGDGRGRAAAARRHAGQCDRSPDPGAGGAAPGPAGDDGAARRAFRARHRPAQWPDQDQFGQSTDPLGRTLPGAGQIDTGDVKIPDQSDCSAPARSWTSCAGAPANPSARATSWTISTAC